MDNKSIGARLKESRKAVRMTQEAVATELGVNRQAVSNWETGRETPRAEAWFLLGQIYGVSLDYIVYGVRTIPVGKYGILASILRPAKEAAELQVVSTRLPYRWLVQLIAGGGT